LEVEEGAGLGRGQLAVAAVRATVEASGDLRRAVVEEEDLLGLFSNESADAQRVGFEATSPTSSVVA
jgi:hypothetical protein